MWPPARTQRGSVEVEHWFHKPEVAGSNPAPATNFNQIKSTMIKLKIDVTKIDKTKLFRAESGAIYLDGVLIETPTSEYNDYMAVQDLPKADRDAGLKGAILGNAKMVKKEASQAPAPAEEPNDLPF